MPLFFRSASACNAGDPVSIPESGRSPGEGNGNPLQYSCLESPMDRGAWRATLHGFAESDTTEWLTHTHSNINCMWISIQEREKSWIYLGDGESRIDTFWTVTVLNNENWVPRNMNILVVLGIDLEQVKILRDILIRKTGWMLHILYCIRTDTVILCLM